MDAGRIVRIPASAYTDEPLVQEKAEPVSQDEIDAHALWPLLQHTVEPPSPRVPVADLHALAHKAASDSPLVCVSVCVRACVCRPLYMYVCVSSCRFACVFMYV
jgi:hypothetical protein